MSEIPRAVGHVEQLEEAASFLFITGWIRVPPEALADAVPELRIGPPDAPPLARPLRRLLPRKDLPARDGLPPGYGFQLVIPLPAPGWTTVAARLALGGTEVAMTPAALRPAPLRARGALEPPDRWGIPGWVLDLPGSTQTLLVDGRHRLAVTLDKVRADLPFDDGAEEPVYGFRIPLHALAEAVRAADPGATLLDWERHSVSLLLGGTEMGHRVFTFPRRMGGALEVAADGEAVGWGTEADGVEHAPTVEVLLDGTRWQVAKASRKRDDLVANGVGTRLRGGAFRIDLPRLNPAEAPAPLLELRPTHAREVLGAGLALAALPPWRPDRGRLLDTLPRGGWPRVSVVVPIHNAAADLARCIDSVVRHSTGDVRLILIDDASTDPAVAEVLVAWSRHPDIEVHRNAGNLGFTATVNRGTVLAGADDVVLLNSDTMVGPGWLDGLRVAAWSAPNIGTVTPLSNNAGAFSVPEFDVGNRLPEWFAPADMARLARQASLSLLPGVPTGNGFCLYIRRDCLDVVGDFDVEAFPRGYGEENDFCLRAQRAGFENLVDDRSWVWHRRSASFGEARGAHLEAGRAVLAERYPEYRTLTGVFRDDPAFLAIRWRIRRAVEAALEQGALPRPRLLFVISTQSGGTPQTNRDLMAALADRYEPWVLRCDGRQVELVRHGEDQPLEVHRLERAMLPGLHRAAEYDRIVADLLLRYGFELVHIRHIAWHGLGLTEVCQRLGIPVVFSFHDFYTVCPTVKLLDSEGRFCGGRCTVGEEDCRAELWQAAAMPPLRDRFVHRWRQMMEGALACCDAFVTTSPFARDTLLDAFPDLAERDFRLIQHGRSFARLESLAAEPMLDEPLRVLVPGNISVAKGAALIARMAELDADREVEFHILGNVDATLAQPRAGVVLHGAYARDAFAGHLHAIRPHLAAVLSIWPETYCHTLTECWAAGLPVIATALGATAERIGADGGGWLVAPEETAEAILARLSALKRDLPALRAQRDAVLNWQRRIGRHYDTAGMAAAYDLLYREVIARRRSLSGGPPTRVPVVLAVPRRLASDVPLALPLRNDWARPVVIRPTTAAHPFGDAAAGPGDLVVFGAGAVRPRDIPGVLARCRAAGLPLVVEADAGMAALLAQRDAGGAAIADLLRASALVLAETPAVARELAAAGVSATTLPPLLDAAAWLAPIPSAPPLPPEAPCRVLDFVGATWLDDLAAIGVAEAVAPQPVEPGVDPVPAFRRLVQGCTLALLPALAGGDDPRRLACAAAGLVILRDALPGEAPGETADGGIILSGAPLAAERTIGELSVDPERVGRLARLARRDALARMTRGGQAAALDALLLSALKQPLGQAVAA